MVFMEKDIFSIVLVSRENKVGIFRIAPLASPGNYERCGSRDYNFKYDLCVWYPSSKDVDWSEIE